jgi:hypothetical protein
MKTSIIKMLVLALLTSFISFGTGMSNSYAQQKDSPTTNQQQDKNRKNDRKPKKKDKKKDRKPKKKDKKNKHKHHKNHHRKHQ